MGNFTIDRFEGEWAVLEDEQGRMFNIPNRWLPAEAREGMVLRISQETPDGSASTLRIELDPAGRDQRLAEARRLRDQFPRAPKGDISL